MIQFQCDYNQTCHPAILEALGRVGMEQMVGYGEDHYCQEARRLIRQLVGREDADVHFLVGGTQTNMTVISSALRPYQGVIAADTGHINVHETGAIEHSGHKVIALPARNGKIDASQVKAAIDAHYAENGPEHTVQPGMVYISFPTEVGTIYSLAELEAIHDVCRSSHVPLFIDGARLGYGLCSPQCDVTLRDIARLADVFYIGGTKVGAMMGEAVVITADELKRDFRYHIKQNGGMLAKGWLLGVQFLTLFTDNLYMRIAQNAINQAMRLRDALKDAGYTMYAESPTNQQFVVITDEELQRLSRDFLLEPWGRVDSTHMAVRICTSWATTDADIDRLTAALCAR
ncbi:MAG: aminotransferase class I/II-fold pyridoxal phosphate-dependent enzyme [Bacteroidaceae bacterium]|nr:aminotransferase class I/II-fold pyridoxal phosphate-dependent enzyme [Bacteroidaceae bacterium]